MQSTNPYTCPASDLSIKVEQRKTHVILKIINFFYAFFALVIIFRATFSHLKNKIDTAEEVGALVGFFIFLALYEYPLYAFVKWSGKQVRTGGNSALIWNVILTVLFLMLFLLIAPSKKSWIITAISYFIVTIPFICNACTIFRTKRAERSLES